MFHGFGFKMSGRMVTLQGSLGMKMTTLLARVFPAVIKGRYTDLMIRREVA